MLPDVAPSGRGDHRGGSLQCFENDLPFFSFENFAKEAQGQCSAAPLALSLLFSPADPVAVQQD